MNRPSESRGSQPSGLLLVLFVEAKRIKPFLFENILPAFEKGNIPVVLAADNKYVPYVTTLLRSIIDNANQEKNYDFVILNSNISDLNKEKIKREFVQSTNMSIRFANVKRLFAKYDLYVHRHFTV